MTASFLFIHINEWAPPDSPDAVPISLAYILAYLKKHGYDGTILGDYKSAPLSPQLLKKTITSLRPKALGFTVYDENINRMRSWARFAKKIDPDLTIVLGGPQITFMPGQALLDLSEADILCRGNGEPVMLALAKSLESDGSFKEVKGICYRNNSKIIETAPCLGVEDLDDLPSPYLEDLVDLSGKTRVILLSSRGCTSPCTFCYTTRASGKKIRFHSIDRMIAEMEHLKNKGITDFWFADPNFAYSRKRLVSLLEAMIKIVPGIEFWCQTRYNLVDPELLDLMKRAGARTLAFGLESANQPVLKNINKGLDLERLAKAIRMTQDAGIEVELFTMFGLPGETLEQAGKTLDFVKQNNVAVEGNSISQQLHIFFGTPINDDLNSNHITPLSITKPSYLSICRDFETDTMSAAQIRQMSLHWRLNRRDYAEDEHINIFEKAGFITTNHEELRIRSEAGMHLARIYMELEEYEGAHECLARLKRDFSAEAEVQNFLAGPFTGYKVKRRSVAEHGCKVIFDCKGMISGKVIPATETYYQEGVLGDGTLLPDFEKGITGLKAGRWTQFDVTFPDDYGNQELAGRTATFQVVLHLVMEPVTMENMEDIRSRLPPNKYRFTDLQSLRENNEKLYYMVLRDTSMRGVTQDMTDYLTLVNFYLKLGFFDKAWEMAGVLPEEPGMRNHASKIYLANGRAREALSLIDPVAAHSTETKITQIKCFIKLERYNEAEQLAGDPALTKELQALDLRVGIASYLQLPEETYLQRMDDLLENQVESMIRDAG